MNRPSPYVRRRWLGREIRRLREEHGVTGESIARALQFPRQQISALENGHLGPDIDLVSGICDYLAVGVNRRTAIMDAAADGWARGWWVAEAERMGIRQAVYADLESGTKNIAEYAISLIPGLLQTPAFADARLRSEPARHGDRFEPASAVTARGRRQSLVLAAGGPRYEAVIDEIAIRRSAADPVVVAEQLRHVVDVCAHHPSVTVQVLPVDASIRGHSAPRSAYSIYRYRDPQNSQAVAVDTLTHDVIHTDPDELDPYLSLHGRLKAAALSPESSIRLLRAAAERLAPTEGVSV
ncbi:DNA-binding protein [Micromonospora endophytica]|uniref:DNA-binding protein n=1 Tax=Micromonospora endophytica TaxID=515350 RepID=A0A2W2CET1_9ACTN|nr:helix-turn-helix transcriptional regulator [Micromonospora endophytica]PZF97012.1 DNA-binding protein [Micromonospora endophytica]RIW41193.1 XRE family transcriptional regulator [Micromonospora endophytica]BCJ58184.1 transcriptional regulator [Micromonospora endophytica]